MCSNHLFTFLNMPDACSQMNRTFTIKLSPQLHFIGSHCRLSWNKDDMHIRLYSLPSLYKYKFKIVGSKHFISVDTKSEWNRDICMSWCWSMKDEWVMMLEWMRHDACKNELCACWVRMPAWMTYYVCIEWVSVSEWVLKPAWIKHCEELMRISLEIAWFSYPGLDEWVLWHCLNT